MIIVSVIIPYYKKKDYIKSTIKSVLNQTFKSYEIIIVYDDEYRNDLVYLKKKQSLDKRIKIILNSKNIEQDYQEIKQLGLRRENILLFWTQMIYGIKKIITQLRFYEKKSM